MQKLCKEQGLMKYSTKLSDAVHILAFIVLNPNGSLTSDSIAKAPLLLHCFAEELLHPVKRDHIHFVIEICMDGVRNDHQFFVVCIRIVLHHVRICVSAEVAGMCHLPVDDQDCAADLICVFQDRLVHKGDAPGHVPSAVGIERTCVISSFCLIVVMVVFNKEGRVIRRCR